MSIPINNLNRSATESLNSKTASSRLKTSSDGDDVIQSSEITENERDTVSLSAESAQVRGLQNRLGDIPEVDAEKVARIKKEIANGNYPVDSKAIADNLLQLEKALGK